MRAVSENPFCTRRVRPGAIPFLFPPDQTAEALIERLQTAGWRGEIVGPHGSGKSTLLASLISVLERVGRRTVLVELHDGQRRLPPELWSDARLETPAVLVIDGYEQLSRFSRFRLRWFCHRRGVGLLITTHQPMGLPTLCQTAAYARTGRADCRPPVEQSETAAFRRRIGAMFGTAWRRFTGNVVRALRFLRTKITLPGVIL